MKIKYARLNTALVLIIGAVLWNSWLLGWVNHGSAGYLHMSISELEVRGQPYWRIFNFCELASGLMLLLGGIGILIAKARVLHFLPLIAAAIILLGGLTIFDTTHPLDCTQYRDPVCITLVRAGRISHTASLHQTESDITAFVTIFLALVTIGWAVSAGWHWAELLLAVGLLAGIVAGLLIINSNDYSIESSVAERVWNVLVSVNIMFVALKLSSHPNRRAAAGGQRSRA